MKDVGDATVSKACEATVEFMGRSGAVRGERMGEADVRGTRGEVRGGGGAITNRGTEAARKERIVGNREGKEGGKVKRGGGPSTSGTGSVPEPIVKSPGDP